MIGFPNRRESFKRTADAVAAISIIREKLGADTQFWSFGTQSARTIPRCVQCFRFPSDELLRSLYHRTRIFMVPSQYEGWGLPGSEAMACGAALVSTDNGGVRGYGRTTRTPFCVPQVDPTCLPTPSSTYGTIARAFAELPKRANALFSSSHGNMPSTGWRS